MIQAKIQEELLKLGKDLIKQFADLFLAEQEKLKTE